MHFQKPIPKSTFFQRACRFLLGRKRKVLPELQAAINDCTNLSQVLDLLFSTDFTLDEAICDAFDRRIEELERCTNTTFDDTLNLHLKKQYNGTRTV